MDEEREEIDIKNMTPLQEGEITPEAEDAPVPSGTGQAGFHVFPAKQQRRFSLPKFSLIRKRFGKGAFVALVLALLLVVLGLLPALASLNSAKRLVASGKELNASLQSQNLEQVKSSLEKVKGDLRSFDRSLTPLVWTKFIPFVGGYWNDAKHASRGGLAGVEAAELLLVTVEPYADIIGFDGQQEGPKEGAQTAEERIDFVVETIDEIIPQLDEMSARTEILTQEINQINPNRYPEHFRGKPVREPLKKGISLVNQFDNLVTGGRPLLEQAPYLLGIDERRTFLFIWQNDKELRPTGGFITAYSVIDVEDGKFQPVVSDDIYKLDGRFNSRIPAPEPIEKYLPLVPYWYLRDMNLSPDFKVSMDTFHKNYSQVRGIEEVEGIIAVDTHVLVNLLRVMGVIGVPGFGNYSAEEDPRCNCPQVIYELEDFADTAGPIVWDPVSGEIVYKPPHADARKAFLGPMMNSIIANAMAQPKNKLPGLFEVAWNALQEKHVLFYFLDPEAQKGAEAFGIAGRIKEFDGDYLHINDTNFAGAKSNLYVKQEVDLRVEPGKNGTTNTLTVRYKNPQKYDGWLNGPFRDWVRIYVPKGSQLIDSTGSEVPVTTSEDLGKTVFEGFFTLRPLGVLELRFQYKTPVQNNADYKILIQKQPGTEGAVYKVEVSKKKQEFQLLTDKELRF